MNTPNSSGSFRRRGPRFQDRIVATPEGEGQWPVEKDRYRMVVSLACPWAHRSIITRRLTGLEDALSMAIVDPFQDERSWRFTLDEGGVDPTLGIGFLAEAYEARDPDNDNGVSVPAVVDVATASLVTNDYLQLPVDLNIEWAQYARPGAPSLYPPELRDEIDTVMAANFDDVNNGVYKAGFATTQKAYETAFTALFARLDEMEERLTDRRYLVGDHITLADIGLYTTLARFDAAYHGHFKCNRNKLTEYAALWAYARDLYQTPGFGDTTDFDHIKRHYYQVHTSINPTQIVPLGPELSVWHIPHDREDLGGSPFGDGTPPEPLTEPLRPLAPLEG